MTGSGGVELVKGYSGKERYLSGYHVISFLNFGKIPAALRSIQEQKPCGCAFFLARLAGSNGQTRFSWQC